MNAVGNEQLAFAVPAASGRTEPEFSGRTELQGCSIKELNVQGRSILWSCCGLRPSTNASKCRKQNKSRLLRALLKTFVRSGPAADLGLTEIPLSCIVVSDRLGKPRLVLNDAIGPSISFSHCNGKTWAALAGRETDVGIDAARGDDFEGDYPFHRVFHRGELAPLLEKTDGNRGESAALVWSAKEAFVKALGCAFHLFSPLEVSADPLGMQFDRALFRVRLSDKGMERVPSNRGSQMEISSFKLGGAWVSVAAADRNCMY